MLRGLSSWQGSLICILLLRDRAIILSLRDLRAKSIKSILLIIRTVAQSASSLFTFYNIVLILRIRILKI